MQTLEATYNNRILTFKTPPQKNHCKVLVTFLENKTEKAEKNKEYPKIDVNKLMKENKSSIDKWAGCLKGADISNWKEDRIKYLMEKHK